MSNTFEVLVSVVSWSAVGVVSFLCYSVLPVSRGRSRLTSCCLKAVFSSVTSLLVSRCHLLCWSISSYSSFYVPSFTFSLVAFPFHPTSSSYFTYRECDLLLKPI